MDFRILIAVAVALVVVAFGGFYFALSSRQHEPLAASQPRPARTAEAPATAPPAAQQPAAQARPPAATSPSAAPPPPAQPAKATPESIDAEIAKSDHADLQALLKRYFADDYKALIAVAVERRNEGVSDQAFGQELFARFQDIMRSKLRFAAGAGTAMIDRLAENEVALFRALGTEGATFCLKVLGKDETPADSQPPESVRRMMRLGTLFRFQAIVEGMSNTKPVDPLTQAELGAFEASLNRDGLRFDEVRSGAFLSKGGDEPGKPCLMIEKLYRSIARLEEGTRRKIYAGMFFLGRDR
jgi:nitrogen fixation-related uncharacterized protein